MFSSLASPVAGPSDRFGPEPLPASAIRPSGRAAPIWLVPDRTAGDGKRRRVEQAIGSGSWSSPRQFDAVPTSANPQPTPLGRPPCSPRSEYCGGPPQAHPARTRRLAPPGRRRPAPINPHLDYPQPLGLTGALSQYLSATANEGRPEKEQNGR